MPALDYRLVDADNHCFEPRDSFTRYIDPAFRDQAVHQQIRDDGKEWIMIGEQPLTFLPGHDLYDNVGKPGSLKEKLRRMKKTGEAEEFSIFEPVRPEYLDRDLRLDVMDAQNVEACLMFPSVGVTVEHFMATPEQCYANFHAFNRWIQDDWGFAYQNRIFAPPMLSLWDLDAAVAELEWVLSEGAKVIALRPGPQYGRSPSDPYFDPFWARLNEAGGSVAFHLTESGYNEMVSPYWGYEPNPSNFTMSAWQWTNCYGDRPIMETLSALVFENFFGRFPNITAVSVENGAEWAPYLVRLMNKMRGMGRNGPWIGGRLPARPPEIFAQHVLVTPYPEDDVAAIVRDMGADSIVLGSDWPHAEGLPQPADFLHQLATLPAEDQRKIMRDNGLRLVS